MSQTALGVLAVRRVLAVLAGCLVALALSLSAVLAVQAEDMCRSSGEQCHGIADETTPRPLTAPNPRTANTCRSTGEQCHGIADEGSPRPLSGTRPGAPALLRFDTSAQGRVEPVLQCVARRGDRGELVAYFGYVNDNPAAVPIPQGPDNEVLPSDHETGQPSSFSPGRVTNAFAVTLTDEEVVWTLRGPDGQTRSAAASARSRPCAAHSGLAEGRFALLMPLLAAATAALWWARSRRRYRSHVR